MVFLENIKYKFTHTWAIKQKATNKQTNLIDTHNRTVVTSGAGEDEAGEGVTCVVTGHWALGGEHTVEHADDALRNCAFETYCNNSDQCHPINLILKIDSSRNRKSD